MFLGVDGQLVIYHSTDGLTSSCPSTVISPVPQVQPLYLLIFTTDMYIESAFAVYFLVQHCFLFNLGSVCFFSTLTRL